MNELKTFDLIEGSTPVLISLPHTGTQIPESEKFRYSARALDVEDTDWHLTTLYYFARALGASMIAPVYSRYLIDLNRPPENTPMYAGSNNTELCPTHFFTGDAIYQNGKEPAADEIEQRVNTYWRPYHSAIRTELERLRQKHGHAILFDAHSIKSVLPWLFEGQLPDLNLGTANGKSCASSLRTVLSETLTSQNAFTNVVDGRFKGGHITRHFGKPEEAIHAVQLEMTWRCYMEEKPPYQIDMVRSQNITPVLRKLIQNMIEWRPK